MSRPVHFIPFHFSEWITDEFVQSLSGNATKAYLNLLCWQLSNDGLKDDEDYLQRCSGLKESQWKQAWTEIESKFPVGDDGKRRDETYQSVYEKVTEKITKLSEAGTRGNLKRWGPESPPESPPESQQSKVNKIREDNRESDSLSLTDKLEENPNLSLSLREESVERRGMIDTKKCKQDYNLLYESYPTRNGNTGKAEGYDVYVGLMRKGDVTPEEILNGAVRYSSWATANEKIGTEYIKMIPSWLRKRGWEEPYNTQPKEESWAATKARYGLD